ncbi:MAG TPA: pyruvate dehydrogenase complex dihydrolipoamide acetyltransferase [Stellaceae bacterium]|nr:pyruvate dehydrogenase complex dihydrolipoamide acetyltransferase [Stellaceae bacterium]
MPIELLMPALSPTMTEGALAKWHKKEGDEVKAGDIIAEIETDKATMEFEAVDEGKLGRILVPEGTQGVKVNQPIALLLQEGEDASAARAPAAAPAPRPASPAPAPAAPAPKTLERPREEVVKSDGRIVASPLARRMAEQAGLDLAKLTGSGPHGRIVKADIDRLVTKSPESIPASRPGVSQSKAQVVALAGEIPFTEIPHTAMRRIIARRMVEAKQTIPHFTLTIDCEIDALLKMRSELNAMSETKLSVNDMVIRAAALTLKKVPAANASWSEDAILRWNTVDIAVAVALEDGLITPIIRQADQKGLAAIAAESKDLSTRAREGKLKLNEFQGGTFSISNLGMYGIREFAAVINPPHGAILAVGAGEERPVVKNGALAIAKVMSCTLACDHRVVDGAVGAQWLAAFKRLIEAPLAMLL